MKKTKLPKGWTEARLKRVISHYEGQSDDEAVAEDEAAREDSSVAFVAVPQELVDEVQELIRKRTGTDG